MAYQERKDDSGFSDQQRHDVIMQTLTTLDKGPQCFQLRWREKTGEYLTGDILLKTPMFWFMKYKWSRQEIETLFFKARVEIDEKFDMALQQTFGGDPGPRWKGGGGVNRRKWNRVDDVDQSRVWHEADDEKKGRDDDYVDPSSNDYKFQYHPVDQPVDFQATGGTADKSKTEDYSKWKEPSGDNICSLLMECPDGQRLTLKVKPNEPLHYVKKQIAVKTEGKFPEKDQKLRFRGNVLKDDEATLQSIGFRDGDVMQMSCGDIKVFVETKDGRKVEVMVDPHDPITALKAEIERKGLRKSNEQRLFKTKQRAKAPNNELVDDRKSLFDYGLKEGDTVYLGGPTVWRPPTGNDAFPVFVDCPDGKTLTLNVTKSDDIGYTKLQIETLTKRQYPVDGQMLKFKGKVLEDDDETLGDLGIGKNATLQMSMGSIPVFIETREGKVLSLMVDPHDTVNDLKQVIESQTGGPNGEYPVKHQRLFNKLGTKELNDDNVSLSKCGITANSELFLGGTIPIKIRQPDGSMIALEVDPNDQCQSIKQQIAMKTKNAIPVHQQTLQFGGMTMSDKKAIKSYNVQNGDVIDLKLTHSIMIEKPNGERFKLEVSPNDTVMALKKVIEDKFIPSVPVHAQILQNGDTVMDDDNAPLSKYGVNEESVLKLKVDEDDPLAMLEKILNRESPPKERVDALKKVEKLRERAFLLLEFQRFSRIY